MSLQVSAHSHVFITDDRNLKMYETERGSGNSREKVVVKKALGEDLEDKKNFVKEARILRDLQHPNIVNFKGICTTPVALILEYAYFDFMPFGMNSKVSSLSGFLATLNDYDCAGFDDPRIFSGICQDIVTGLIIC